MHNLPKTNLMKKKKKKLKTEKKPPSNVCLLLYSLSLSSFVSANFGKEETHVSEIQRR